MEGRGRGRTDRVICHKLSEYGPFTFLGAFIAAVESRCKLLDAGYGILSTVECSGEGEAATKRRTGEREGGGRVEGRCMGGEGVWGADEMG